MSCFKNSLLRNKKPAGGLAGGLLLVLDLSGRLLQAMAVRRHGGPMMMVVTGMAVALHLLVSYGIGQPCVK
jgi:hypothetical protein